MCHLVTKIESKQTEHAGRRAEFSVKVKHSVLVKTSTNERERMSVSALNCAFRDVIDSFLRLFEIICTTSVFIYRRQTDLDRTYIVVDIIREIHRKS